MPLGFYTFEIDAASQKLCVISTPNGLYKYKRLPMGITNSPDFFQSVMHPLFSDLSHVECFIDNICIFSLASYTDHPVKVHQVLLRLERNSFTVNPLKCEWAAQTTEYLGFLLTPPDIKPLLIFKQLSPMYVVPERNLFGPMLKSTPFIILKQKIKLVPLSNKSNYQQSTFL